MKFIALAFMIFSSIYCFAADETDVIVATGWSAPVESNWHAIRARLLILSGSEPAYGGQKTDNHTMMFIELQNAQGASGGSDKLFFDVMGLKLNLVDASGKSAPKPEISAWGGRGPFSPSWVVIPYNSTIRLYVNGGSKSPLTICQSGEPWKWWEIPSRDTNIYYLTGTLTISTAANATMTAMPHEQPNIHEYAEWQGTLVFPKVEISAGKFVK